MIAAKDFKVSLDDPVNVGDVTIFNINGEMRPVEVTRCNHDGSLDLITCDLELVFKNQSKGDWLRQVQFLKQLEQ